MKHKISICLFVIFQTGCGIEVRDKNAKAPETIVKTMSGASLSEYMVEGPVILTADAKITADRVVLKRSALITTQDHMLEIRAREFAVEEGALIRNFPEGQAAPREIDGRHGGADADSCGASQRQSASAIERRGGRHRPRCAWQDRRSYHGLPAQRRPSRWKRRQCFVEHCRGSRLHGRMDQQRRWRWRSWNGVSLAGSNEGAGRNARASMP